MSFKLENKNNKCVLNNIVCYERIDIVKVIKLIHSSLLKSNFNNPFCKKNFSNEKEQLYKYIEYINDGIIKVKYNKTNDMDDWGRVFPLHSLGLYSIRRQIRHTLAKDYYIDIDIENCHPVILYQLCEQKNVSAKALKKYIKHRNDYLNMVSECFLMHIEDKHERRDKAKNLFIRLLFFGNIDNWIKDNNLTANTDYAYHEDLMNFLKKFTYELSQIGKQIIADNPELEKLVEDKKSKRDNELSYNKKGSIVSYYLQEYECRILELIFNYMVSKNIINIDRPDVILCADGLMIPRKKYEEYNGSLLDDIQIEIKKHFNFDLRLTTKDMDEDYLDILDKSIIDKENCDKFYDVMKENFEKKHFKLMHPTMFAEIMHDDTILLRNQTNFLTAYNHLKYIEVDYKVNKDEKLGSKLKENKFITKWIGDANLKIYNKMDFLPKMHCPEKVYNTFSGFNADKLIKNEAIKVDFEKTKVYKHIKNLCGNDDKTIKYFLNCLALKVQKPYKLAGTSIIFRSVEGCGKDSFFNFLGDKILNHKYYLNEDNIDLIFGKFNQSIENKLLVVINETSGGDTFNKINRIKNAITREINIIERKGIEAYENKNNILFIFLTNNEVAMKIDINDRRFICIDCDSSIAQNKLYFDELYKDFDNNDIAIAFYEYLLNRNIEGFDFIKDRPDTNFYKSLREHNINPFLKFIESEYEENFNEASNKDYTDLFGEFSNYLHYGKFKYEVNRVKFGIDIKKYDFIEKKKTKKGFVYVVDFIKFNHYMVKNKFEIIDFLD